LKKGDQVKIKRGQEKFWVTIEGKGRTQGLWWGVIDNYLIGTYTTKEFRGHGLKFGDKITFVEEDILEIVKG